MSTAHADPGTPGHPLRRSLPLFYRIVLPALLLTLLVSALLYVGLEAKARRQGQDELMAKLTSFSRLQAVEMADAVWAFDQQRIDRLVNSYELLEDLLTAQVYDVDGRLLAAIRNKAPESSFQVFQSELPLVHKGLQGPQEVGRLSISFHDGRLRTGLLRKKLSDLLFTGFFVLIFLGAFIVAMHLQIGRPLARLKAALDANLDRAEPGELPWPTQDELGDVVRAHNAVLAMSVQRTRRLGEVNAMLTREIASRRLAEESLVLVSKVFETALEGVLITDGKGLIIKANASFCAIYGYSLQELVGVNATTLHTGIYDGELFRRIRVGLQAQGKWAGEVTGRRRSGEQFPLWLNISAVQNESGKLTHCVSMHHDITELHKQQELIRHHAYHDALTGLPNRLLLEDRLRLALSRAERSGCMVGLLFLDLDNFKYINDRYGHDTGDAVLAAFAARLRGLARDHDTLARFGGDEFVVMLPDLENGAQALGVARRIVESMQSGLEVDGASLDLGTSIGLSFFPEHGRCVESLLKKADAAMYQAKRNGRNNFRAYQDQDAFADRQAVGLL